MYTKENPETIREMFNHIAQGYDRANAILSLSLHKQWNRTLWNSVAKGDTPTPLLDLCCGTGETSLPFLRKEKRPTEAFLLDFSEGMLACAQEKGKQWPLSQHTIHYLQADAQKIPLPDHAVHSTLMAYAIRNVENPEMCLEEIYRVLAPKGRVGILELTRPTNTFLRWGHSLYLRSLPLLGRWITANQEAYSYLCNSIHAFLDPATLIGLFARVGFHKITVRPLSGGIATLFLAEKSL